MSGWGALGLGGDRKPRRTASVSGFLWKMKRTPRVLTPQWTRRFFALEGRRLRWFESEAAQVRQSTVLEVRCLTGQAERGSVDLRTLTGVSRCAAFEGSLSHWTM